MILKKIVFNVNGVAAVRGFSDYVKRDLQLAYRSLGDTVAPLIFFTMVCTLVPLGLSPDTQRLSEVAPGMLWIMALLSTLLSIERIFIHDYEDGSLEQLLIAPQLIEIPILGKIVAHWLVTGLPLTLMSPLLGLMLSLPGSAYPALLLSLAIGTAYLSAVGAVGASLTVSLGRGGLLLPLLVVPLYMPIIIFGTATVTFAVDAMQWLGPLAAMGAMLCAAIALCPLAAAAALRFSSI
ncbi:MAG: heme exporter protein CcmB [Cellvibrionales bacterium]